MNYITFDIETYSPSKLDRIDTDEFRVSVIGAYISWTDQYVAFMEEDVDKFIELAMSAELIVGFNHIWFDVPVLYKYLSEDKLIKLPNYDIILKVKEKLGFNIKLDDLAKNNLNVAKTDTYDKYVNYYWDEKWYELIDYCMNDVWITEQLFRKAINGDTFLYKHLTGEEEFTIEPPKAGTPASLLIEQDNEASLF